MILPQLFKERGHPRKRSESDDLCTACVISFLFYTWVAERCDVIERVVRLKASNLPTQ